MQQGGEKMKIGILTARQLIFCLASLVILSAVCAAHSNATSVVPVKEEYTGTVVGVGGRLGGVSRPFTLTIEGQSSDAEAARAIAMLAEGGQDVLMKELHGKRLGFFSMGAQLGRDLNFVRETPTANGGRRIVILFERWMNTFEVRSGSRSEEYPFTYLELTLDSSGKGSGQLIPAARIYFDKNHGDQVDIENFGIYPAKLMGVELRNKN
jgi:hypothetical protein